MDLVLNDQGGFGRVNCVGVHCRYMVFLGAHGVGPSASRQITGLETEFPVRRNTARWKG